jgi:hypothetical protein
MDEQLKKKSLENHPLAFRTSTVARQQINDLMRKWHENQTQVMLRCLERVWMAEIGIHEGAGGPPE